MTQKEKETGAVKEREGERERAEKDRNNPRRGEAAR